MYDIVAVGELLIDFSPIKTGDGLCFKDNPGGAPANMLTIASNLGAKTAFIGKVGNDKFGKKLGSVLIDNNIDTKGLVYSDQYNTTLAFVHLDKSGERSFSFYRDGCADVMLEKSDVDFDLIDKAKAVHFGSLSFTNEPSRSTVLSILQYAKSKNKIITYDPNYRPALWSSRDSAVSGMELGLDYADIIKVSDEEAELLTGEKDHEAAAKALYGLGIKIVCITLGNKGSFFYHKGGSMIVNVAKCAVKDTTGAGDTFFGAAVYQILQLEKELDEIDSAELEKILHKSNIAASICIEGLGGIPSIPTEEAIVARLRDV